MSKYDYFDLFKFGEQEFSRDGENSYFLFINDTIIRFITEGDRDVPVAIEVITDNEKIKETIKFKRTELTVKDIS